MASPTAEELFANVSGLTPERAQQVADDIDECRYLLATGASMDAVQQHLKEQGVGIIQAIFVTTRLLGDHPNRLRAAREIVECSPARTATPPE